MTPRVVIVGGGAIGCSLAWALAGEPAFRGRVTVLERDPAWSQASSARSAASIRQQFSTAVNIRLSRASLEVLRAADRHLRVDDPVELGLVEPGYLFLATAAGLPVLEANVALARAEGAAVELLGPAALAQRFPWLSGAGLAAGAHGTRGEGWFDGYALLRALRRKAAALGAQFIDAEATGFEGRGARLAAVRLARNPGSAAPERLEGDVFVNAAGPWAARVAAWAGIALPVRARRRTVFAFRCARTLAGCPLVVDPGGAWFRPEGTQFIAGCSPPEHADADDLPLDPDPGLWDEALWPALAARVPAFEALRTTRAWAGYYEMNTVDANGIVGAHPAVENLLFANGFSGHGLQHAPAIGRALAELIVHGEYRSVDCAPLGWARILEGRPLRERNVV